MDVTAEEEKTLQRSKLSKALQKNIFINMIYNYVRKYYKKCVSQEIVNKLNAIHLMIYINTTIYSKFNKEC
jgi:hypothetical protein